MNNPELVSALCDQVKVEAEALQKANWNIRNAINNETKDMFTEMQIRHVCHLQNLVMSLTQEMTPEESAEFKEQMDDSALQEGEE